MSVVLDFFLFFFRCQVKLSVASYLQEMLYIDILYFLKNYCTYSGNFASLQQWKIGSQLNILELQITFIY